MLMIKYDPTHEQIDRLALFLWKACKSVKNQGNYDKSPYKQWYYRSKRLLKDLGYDTD